MYDYNTNIRNSAKINPLIQFINPDDYFGDYSVNEIFNWKYFILSRMIISPVHAQKFRLWLEKQFRILLNKRKKCLVIDLDNTLWGGILGEDGISGISLGDDYPGLSYRIFQEFILEAGKKGIILTVCSKNNKDDVIEAWNKHPGMILKQKHFSAIKINWENKAKNIVELANELNIGLDSMVFIDDNPAERELVKQVIPEVIVPDFPDQAFELPEFFNSLWNQYFAVYDLTKEDLKKTEQYRQNVERVQYKKDFVDETDYLKSLQMELVFMKADEFNINRIAQMTQKTNQFNLTTKRHSIEKIKSLLNDGNAVYCLHVKDRFGDNGITAAAIIELNGATAFIDVFLLSCRIIGRKIEDQFLQLILNDLLTMQVNQVKAQYIPTDKNVQTVDYYEKMGFNMIKEESSGIKNYELILTAKFEDLDYFSIMNQSGIDE